MLSHRGRQLLHPKLVITHRQGHTAHKIGRFHLSSIPESFEMTADARARRAILHFMSLMTYLSSLSCEASKMYI
jgi:hypothetical protein